MASSLLDPAVDGTPVLDVELPDFTTEAYKSAYSRINAIVIEGEQEAHDNYISLGTLIPDQANELAQLAPAAGRRVVITTDHQTLEATIDRISAELDTRSRFAKAYIPLTQTAEAPTALQPGTFADVVIFGPNFPDSLVVPESALQANGAIWFVKEGELSQHQPQLLGRNDQGIVISSFDYADGIVVSPLATPSPGMTVNPVAKATLPVQTQR